MALILSQLFNGLLFGLLLALVSVGLTVILGTLGVLNFAHGAMFMVGAYIGYTAINITGSFVIGILASGLGLLLIGLIMERGFVRHFYLRTQEEQILLTFGIGMILVELLRFIYGGIARRVEAPDWAGGVLKIGSLIYPEYRVVVIFLVSLILLIIYLGLYKTTLGLTVRAGIEDQLMARMLGIRIDRTFVIVFALGSMAVGVAGVIYAPITAITPDMAFNILVISFVVVVIGGLGSFGGAVIGGIIAGEVQSITSIFDPSLSEVMLFAVMAAILVLRPSGLLGVVGRN